MTPRKCKTFDIYKYQKLWKVKKTIGKHFCTEWQSPPLFTWALVQNISSLKCWWFFRIWHHINSSSHHFKYRSGKHKHIFYFKNKSGLLKIVYLPIDLWDVIHTKKYLWFEKHFEKTPSFQLHGYEIKSLRLLKTINCHVFVLSEKKCILFYQYILRMIYLELRYFSPTVSFLTKTTLPFVLF